MAIVISAELETQLEAAARADRDALLADIDRIRAMTPPGPKTDSADILRQARDDRNGHGVESRRPPDLECDNGRLEDPDRRGAAG